MASRHAVINPGAAIAPGKQHSAPGGVAGPIVSAVEVCTRARTKDVRVRRWLDAIVNGHWHKKIEKIRRTYRETEGDPDRKKRAIEGLKKTLPAVLWSGCFERRKNNALIQHSGLLCIDLDQLGERLGRVRSSLHRSPYVYAVFLSPSGDGLKALFRVPADGSRHLDSYHSIEKYVFDLCSIQIDESCKDVARLCFASYDPDLEVNEAAVTIEPLEPAEKLSNNLGENSPDMALRERIATEELGRLIWSPEKKGHFCTCPGIALHTNATGPTHTIVYLDGAPTLDCQHNSCRKVVESFNYELRSLIGKAESGNSTEHSSSSSVARDEWATDLSSFTSLDEAKFPPPLEHAAYYGVAGEIVKRIQPETEAHPAAMLTDFVTGFGNLIGRNAYVVADGVRHYCNLFVVTVGPTSTARKGTAWKRVLPVLAMIDDDWVTDNVESGLSSGEGVVHRIRDKIEEEKPVKEKGRLTGEYETVTVDPGIDDKRLLIVETEFCSPLKVMGREGNTLSPSSALPGMAIL